jgi:YfiH family protein
VSIPTLENVTNDGVTSLSDVTLFADTGIRIAFAMRHGGVSRSPFETLNVGAYVGDDPDDVATNRRLMGESLGLDAHALRRLNTAHQVHGIHIEQALARPHEFASTDALITDLPDIPLLLCFADCVPIILVEPDRRIVAVVHAGWRGTLDCIAAHVVERLTETYGVDPCGLLAYIGPHIGLQNFTIESDVARRFFGRFDICKQRGYHETKDGRVNLDLGLLVEETLAKVGVPRCNIIDAKIDTVTHTDDFFSYRAQHQVTGRFGALACICSV